MIAFKVIIVLVIIALVYAGPLTQATGKDAITIDNVIKCVQGKLWNGVPELDVPSFDPFVITSNITIGAQFIFFKNFFTLINTQIYGLPNFTHTFEQLSTDDDDVAHLKFHAILKSLYVNATWNKLEDYNGTDINTFGLMDMLINDFEFDGEIKIQKPLLSGKITEFEVINNKVGPIKITVTNMENNELFSQIFQVLWDLLFSSSFFAKLAQSGLQNISQKWLNQPEKLQQLLSGCSI